MVTQANKRTKSVENHGLNISLDYIRRGFELLSRGNLTKESMVLIGLILELPYFFNKEDLINRHDS